MAMIPCPKCGNEVPDHTSTCPHCGTRLSSPCANPVATLLISQHPHTPGCIVPIKYTNGMLLVNARAGAVIDLPMNKPSTYFLCSAKGKPLLTVTLEPGKKYHATWIRTFFSYHLRICSDETDA